MGSFKALHANVKNKGTQGIHLVLGQGEGKQNRKTFFNGVYIHLENTECLFWGDGRQTWLPRLQGMTIANGLNPS